MEAEPTVISEDIGDEPIVESQSVMSRRAFLGHAAKLGAAVLYAETLDTAYGREFIWNDDKAHLTFLESPFESDEAYVFMMGLGVPNSSTAVAANSQKPMLDKWGHTSYLAPPNTGLTTQAFKEMARETGSQLAEHNVKTVNFICQSAGFDNAVRMLNAPVWQQRSFLGRGVGAPALTMPAADYWQAEYGLRIGNFIAASSPIDSNDVQPGLRREVTRLGGMVPTDDVPGGFFTKLGIHLANNHTLDVAKFEHESDRVSAAWESARDDNSPANLGTQLAVIDHNTALQVQNALGPTSKIGVIAASDPTRDTTVVSQGLRADTAVATGRPIEQVLYREDPAITHGNIAEAYMVYRRLINDILVHMAGPRQH